MRGALSFVKAIALNLLHISQYSYETVPFGRNYY